MCDLVREQKAGAADSGRAALPPNPDRLGARWSGGVAAAAIAGLAVAALVAPPSASPVANAKDPAGPAPLASRAVALPAAPVVEQVAAGLDDGVPAASDVVKRAAGDCHQGL